MGNKIKIGYFGDGEWAHGAFKLFIKDPDIEVQFVVVRNDNPDQVLIDLANKNSIPWVSNPNINSSDFFSWLSSFKSELYVSMSFNQIFRKKIFELPEKGTINCHAGKLPFYRGRNILNWALINDEKDFGITVHYIDEGIDTGDIIEQHIFEITDEDTYKTLLDKAIEKCPIVLHKVIKKIFSGESKRIPQKYIHKRGMYCSQRKIGDENLDWNQQSRDVFNFIRAISHPGPRARCMHEENEVFINKAEMVLDAPIYKGIPGSVLYKDGDFLFVKTADSFIKIVEYEKKGRKLRPGDRLSMKEN
jgi:methionyl-tRNA formyltransferase